MSKGEKPYTAKELYLKLSKLWKLSEHWKLVSLGHGFFEFQFPSLEDMHLAWAHDTMNLKPRVLRLFQWTKDFNTYTQHQNTSSFILRAQVWIRLMNLPREYWRDKTLREISGAVGTPLIIDSATQKSKLSFLDVIQGFFWTWTYRNAFLRRFWWRGTDILSLWR